MTDDFYQQTDEELEKNKALTPQERLLLWIDAHFSSRSEFARQMGMSSQSLRRYTHETSIFGLDKQYRAKNLGLWINWYLNGDTAITNKTEKQFNNEFDILNDTGTIPIGKGLLLAYNLAEMKVNDIKRLYDWYQKNETKIKQILKAFEDTDDFDNSPNLDLPTFD